MKLCDLRDNPGARRKKRLLGRGTGSGLGKTCGRGGKGQTARSGVRLKGFQGGQTPLSRRLPKRGFFNIFGKTFVEVNLWQLQGLVDAERLSVDQPVTAEALIEAGLCKRAYDGIRVLGEGEISVALNLQVTGITASARKAIEKAGGAIELTGLIARSRRSIEKAGGAVELEG
jgi:large subunit ribosomal protein L15